MKFSRPEWRPQIVDRIDKQTGLIPLLSLFIESRCHITNSGGHVRAATNSSKGNSRSALTLDCLHMHPYWVLVHFSTLPKKKIKAPTVMVDALLVTVGTGGDPKVAPFTSRVIKNITKIVCFRVPSTYCLNPYTLFKYGNVVCSQ